MKLNSTKRARWLRLLATLGLLAELAGCTSAHEAPAAPVGGALDGCYVGAYFADCGGEGTPRFGCQVGPAPSACRWFTGGVVAEGYVPWSCADGQICCDDGAGPAFPDSFGLWVASFFNSVGAEPWNRERGLVLSVDVDPTLAGDLSVSCERDGQVVDDVYPCREPGTGETQFQQRYMVYAEMHDTLSVGVLQGDGFVSRRLQLEVMPDRRLARACLLSDSDGVPLSCDPAAYPSGPCAEEGTIRVSTLPARNRAALDGVVVAGEVTFADGLTITFTAPL